MLEAVGAQMLPASLGGQRDDVSEWRDWLRARRRAPASGVVAVTTGWGGVSGIGGLGSSKGLSL